jgi:hypothetical protein
MARQQEPEPEDAEYCRQLDIEVAKIEYAVQGIGSIPREGQAWLDVLLMKLFKWATKNRFLSQ